MPYTTDVFMSWPTTFPTWDALKAWLTSEEGGLLRIVEPRESPFALVRYTRGKSNFALPHVRWCRSVVVEKATRLPVCISPAKSYDLTESSANDAVVAEELVDGTMMNIFNAGSADSVYLATRSRLNADTKFYENGPTFASMLQDALTAQNLEDASVLVQEDSRAFTSIVLQHPANRIVYNVTSPSFTVIHQGVVAEDGRVTIEETPANFRFVGAGDLTNWFPPSYTLAAIRGAKSVESWVSTYAQKTGFRWQGLVLKDGQGKRWRLRSEVYETVRRIRGNEATTEERFARLRKTRSVDQYLAFFPEDREALYELEGRFRKNTRQLFQFYADVFRARTTQFYQLPWPYKHHVSVLHNLFKDFLRSQKKKIDLNEVIQYTNGLSLEDTANMSKVHTLTLRSADPSAPSAPPPGAAPLAAPAASATVEVAA